jgi:hypothetical protein
LELLQELIDGRASVSFNLGPVEFDSQVAEIILGVLELAELWLGQEDLQDSMAGLHLNSEYVSMFSIEG